MKQRASVGFIGLGSMGAGMARNLLAARYAVTGYDLDRNQSAMLADAGARVGKSIADVLASCEVVATSLPDSERWVSVAEADLVPNARRGQLLIDFGTTEPAQTERIAADLAEKGASLVDAPVSGGPRGASEGTLRVFAGGAALAVDQAMGLLRVVGDPEQVHHCGPSGAGQRAKLVNQMAMGLHTAALLEALAFAESVGLSAQRAGTIVGDAGTGWRGELAEFARRVAAGEGDHLAVKAAQLGYMLRAAGPKARLPLTDALASFLRDGEHVTAEAGIPCASFWHELHRR
jgi:3-hydroxyisobutyrate dehydrogenase-like beta-hydroxyacid dehydrogenase